MCKKKGTYHIKLHFIKIAMTEVKFCYIKHEKQVQVAQNNIWMDQFLACRSRQASIVLERYFRFEVSLLSILCMLWRWEPVEFRAIPILLR